MGIPYLVSSLLLCLFSSASSFQQQPNTDGFFVFDFLTKMGAKLSSEGGVASSPCPEEVRCIVEGGHVVSLVASGLGLQGPVPVNTIGKIQKLRYLDLSNNSITGVAPDLYGLGGSLQTLDISRNKIGGSLPNDVGNFGKLQRLDLSFNSFTGQVPVQIGSLGSLTHLNLSHNSFEGSFPKEIAQCRSLASVDISSNKLTGIAPSSLGLLMNLTHLNLAGNLITGRLPDLSGLQVLSYLNLSGNGFVGSISGALRGPLQFIDLSNNKFTGHVSQVSIDSRFWPELVHLDLSGNRLSGMLFAELNEAMSIKHLDLANNRFTHEPFPDIGKLSVLEYLNLSRTGLTGNIPANVEKLVNLQFFDLSFNHLSGQIPNLSSQNLQVIDLSVNNLTGELPLNLQMRLPEMSRFNFSYNNLTFCSSSIPSAKLESAFIGSRSNCPIAANPEEVGTTWNGHLKLRITLAVAISSLIFITGLICIVFALRRRTGPLTAKGAISGKEDPSVSGPFSFETDSATWVADVKDANSVPVVIFEKPLLNFTFADLLSATSHFDRGTLLAEGKFGPVYRGCLPGGFNVAVKVLVNGSTLTDREAANEFERLGCIRHPNLVPLTGYCLAGDQRIAVFDYMEHGNLQNLLHDLPLGIQATDDWSYDTWEDDNNGARSITSEGQTTWKFRHRIALGTARALAFLHHGCIPQIVHKDVKASSVYLDSTFEPRLSDFGLAKIFGSNFEDEIARVSPGYTPPELSGPECGPATSKSDVYAFGVVLFELVTGKKPVGDEYTDETNGNLVSWVRGLVKRNQVADAIDTKILETGQEKQMEEALRIGYLCTADSPAKRPSMQQIVGLLKDIEPATPDQ